MAFDRCSESPSVMSTEETTVTGPPSRKIGKPATVTTGGSPITVTTAAPGTRDSFSVSSVTLTKIERETPPSVAVNVTALIAASYSAIDATPDNVNVRVAASQLVVIALSAVAV
ncbi:hypothetical protein [Mycolicibacterium vaccae]|uniref:hypothetical protein n=1 Tax=Mycolicibacterium vaccae TaxID=1810 RepID=UPI001181C2D5|nr:hypothetical protein [Mycolicibacterium vaccae]